MSKLARRTQSPVMVAAGIDRPQLLAAGYRNPISLGIVVLGPHGITYLAGAVALSLLKVRSILGMLPRIRAHPKIN